MCIWHFLLLDESFAVLHNKRGTLGMANKGPHSNGSQFYITLQPTSWMDRTYVAFGFDSLNCLLHFQFCIMSAFSYSVLFYIYFFSYSSQLVEGIDVLKRLEEIPTFNERPNFECKVADCGVLEVEGSQIHTYSCDVWIPSASANFIFYKTAKCICGCCYLFALSVDLIK